MPQREFDRIELEALDEGGMAAGAYLDALGKTDLAELTEAEWLVFRKTMLEKYSESVREQCAAFSTRD